jgi:putative MFS transporter
MELRDSNVADIVARIERLPNSRWHLKVRSIIGVAWFFDAFDALAIAYVLPALIGMWKMTPLEIGSLIAIGFAGQAVGSLFFGWLAEKIGRLPCAVITLVIFTIFSLACAYAWSLQSLMLLRFIQGIGLGGEIPVMAAYINEIANSGRRGRFTLMTQLTFSIGLFVVALVGVWAVPVLGWHSMFIIGALPAILALPMRMLMPESPRWLASQGRGKEASDVLDKIEREITAEGKILAAPQPVPVPIRKYKISDIFKGVYLQRTIVIWIMWFSCYLVVYGLAGWLPSIYRSVYKLSITQSLQYGLIASGVALIACLIAALLIDKVGRKALISTCLIVGSIPLLILYKATEFSAGEVLVLVSIGFAAINMVALSLGLYTAENYPTELRAMGSGLGSMWVRIASICGPYIVGFVLPHFGIGPVFVLFGLSSLIGGLICLFFAFETRGRLLEEISK